MYAVNDEPNRPPLPAPNAGTSGLCDLAGSRRAFSRCLRAEGAALNISNEFGVWIGLLTRKTLKVIQRMGRGTLPWCLVIVDSDLLGCLLYAIQGTFLAPFGVEEDVRGAVRTASNDLIQVFVPQQADNTWRGCSCAELVWTFTPKTCENLRNVLTISNFFLSMNTKLPTPSFLKTDVPVKIMFSSGLNFASVSMYLLGKLLNDLTGLLNLRISHTRAH